MKLQKDPEVHGQDISKEKGKEKVQKQPKTQPYAPKRSEMLTADSRIWTDNGTEKPRLKTQIDKDTNRSREKQAKKTKKVYSVKMDET